MMGVKKFDQYYFIHIFTFELLFHMCFICLFSVIEELGDKMSKKRQKMHIYSKNRTFNRDQSRS